MARLERFELPTYGFVVRCLYDKEQCICKNNPLIHILIILKPASKPLT